MMQFRGGSGFRADPHCSPTPTTSLPFPEAKPHVELYNTGVIASDEARMSTHTSVLWRETNTAHTHCINLQCFALKGPMFSLKEQQPRCSPHAACPTEGTVPANRQNALCYLPKSAHIIVSTMVWVGLIKPLFPFGSRGCVSSLPFKLYSFGRELTPDFAGAATALIL
ncbi:hypothetical protein INR49_013360 [Caranx melampygus]|nr:hypothetical protein INR49_013360 [Caranx melampygus]